MPRPFSGALGDRPYKNNEVRYTRRIDPRIMVTLLHEMRRRGNKYGLASLCIAGGMGQATVLEAL